MSLKKINWATTWQGVTAVSTIFIAYATIMLIPEEIKQSAQDDKNTAKTNKQTVIIEKNNLQKAADLRKNRVLSESIRAKEIIKLGNAVSSDKKLEAIATLKAYAPEIETFQPKAAQILFNIQKEATASLNQNIEKAGQSEKKILELSNQFDAITRQAFKLPGNIMNPEIMKTKDAPDEMSIKTFQQKTYNQR